jgi:hypothetical protein
MLYNILLYITSLLSGFSALFVFCIFYEGMSLQVDINYSRRFRVAGIRLVGILNIITGFSYLPLFIYPDDIPFNVTISGLLLAWGVGASILIKTHRRNEHKTTATHSQ